MNLHRWNPFRREYEPFAVPDEWRASAYESDLGVMIHCPTCGKQLKAEDAYTSMEIQDPVFGLGYYVCEACHMAELDRRRKILSGGRV